MMIQPRINKMPATKTHCIALHNAGLETPEELASIFRGFGRKVDQTVDDAYIKAFPEQFVRPLDQRRHNRRVVVLIDKIFVKEKPVKSGKFGRHPLRDFFLFQVYLSCEEYSGCGNENRYNHKDVFHGRNFAVGHQHFRVCTFKNRIQKMTGVAFYVLDRPNPITGTRIEGPLLDAADTSFVGSFAGLPVRHGMTMGELAGLQWRAQLGAGLTVIRMRNWSRGDWFDSTGLPWINPSPNMRSLNAATLYPGCACWNLANSVGRGTDAPFEQIGADFIGGRELAAY